MIHPTMIGSSNIYAVPASATSGKYIPLTTPPFIVSLCKWDGDISVNSISL